MRLNYGSLGKLFEEKQEMTHVFRGLENPSPYRLTTMSFLPLDAAQRLLQVLVGRLVIMTEVPFQVGRYIAEEAGAEDLNACSRSIASSSGASASNG